MAAELIMSYVSYYIPFSRYVIIFFSHRVKVYIYHLRGFYRNVYKGFIGVLCPFPQSIPIFMTELFYDLVVDQTIENYYIREKYNEIQRI